MPGFAASLGAPLAAGKVVAMSLPGERGARATESVRDYPRPPRLERVERHLRIELNGEAVAESRRPWRVLETWHPPVYYFPPADVRMEFVRTAGRGSFCEWKGAACYFDVQVGDRVRKRAAWSYPAPLPGFEEIRDHLAFYAHEFDRCTVDGEVVRPQPGGFYGGWITREITGPFKGEPGTAGW
jgi:uncharacterized protein (DUF427 family)